MLVPASALSWVNAITGELAGPEVPKLSLLGFALASGIRSARDLYGSLGWRRRGGGGPEVRKLSFVVFALASAVKSPRDLYGSLASMMRTSGGPSVTFPIGTK